MTALARVLWLLTGALWAAMSLVQFAHPNYWDPVTALDWSSIWIYSAALLSLAASVLLLGRLAPSRRVMIAATVVAIGALGAGVANALEDGNGVSWMGTIYVLGVLTAGIGLLPLAIAFQRVPRSRLAGITAAVFLGVLTSTLGGGLIVLTAFGSLALAPQWFRTGSSRSGEPRAVVG